MIESTPPLLTAALVALVVLLLVVTVLWRRASGRVGRHNAARGERARWGEEEAERLLKRAGYRVVDRQVHRRGVMWVDGDPLEISVRVDLVVKRRGRRYVAEVKTGHRAPDPTLPDTRRQLREYAAFFPDHRLLLVDVEARQIHQVRFDSS